MILIELPGDSHEKRKVAGYVAVHKTYRRDGDVFTSIDTAADPGDIIRVHRAVRMLKINYCFETIVTKTI